MKFIVRIIQKYVLKKFKDFVDILLLVKNNNIRKFDFEKC